MEIKIVNIIPVSKKHVIGFSQDGRRWHGIFNTENSQITWHKIDDIFVDDTKKSRA